MRNAAFVLSSLLLIVAMARAIDDTDPEPPSPGPVSMKIVAKKTTYKLDLQGSTVAEFTKAAKAGKAPPVPVQLELVITNTSKSNVRVRTTSATTHLTLNLKGPGVVSSDKVALPKVAGGKKTSYVILAPRQTLSIPVAALTSNSSATQGQHHYWTETGEYSLEATFRAAFYLDYDPNNKVKLTYLTPKASIKLKVEQ